MESVSECSSVWYERLVRDQEAAGSSPVIPTYLEPVGRHAQRGFSFAEGICVQEIELFQSVESV